MLYDMGDCKPTTPELEAEKDLIAAAQQIVKALGKNRNLTDDTWKILANLGLQLSNISEVNESKDTPDFEEELNVIEQQLDEIRDKIMDWEKDESMTWDRGPEEAYEYLKVVDRAQKLSKSLEHLSLNQNGCFNSHDLLRRAHDLLQTAMARLEEDFRHLLVQNRQHFEPEHVSFHSSEEDIVEASSIASFGDDNSVEDAVLQRDSISQRLEDYVFEMVHPDVIPDLKTIAKLMFDSTYGQECSQMFINVQRDALDDGLYILEMEKLSIEDVLKMEWNTLNLKIRRWTWAVKIFVRVYLAGQKLLSDQIFRGLDPASSVCFVESSKPAVLQLLNFGEAIAIGPHQPEKLIRILDMYEVLADLIPDIDALYSDETGYLVRTECHETLRRLGECGKATFLEFENAVASNVSTNAFPGGGVHHLTRYVMNYIKTLMDYSKALDLVLKDEDKEDSIPVSVSPRMSSVSEEESAGRSSCASPMALHFRALISILECNLDEKSKMYRDESLQHLFLMNNMHYMAEKVKNSELRAELGDAWIRRKSRKVQQQAMSYERATWSSILALLMDEGIQNPGSNKISRTILKERLHSFYLAFEEVYKSQTGWLIPDGQLREDVRISTSLSVMQAYRTFVGRHINHISEKYIKYTAEDLQDYLFHLFEGSQKSLHGYYKK